MFTVLINNNLNSIEIIKKNKSVKLSSSVFHPEGSLCFSSQAVAPMAQHGEMADSNV